MIGNTLNQAKKRLQLAGAATVCVLAAGCASLGGPEPYSAQAWVGKPVATATKVFGQPSSTKALPNGATDYAWYGLYDRTYDRPLGYFMDPGYYQPPFDQFEGPDYYPPLAAFGNPEFDGPYPYPESGLNYVAERRLVKCKVSLTAEQGVIKSFKVQNLTTPDQFMAGGCDNYVTNWVQQAQ
ncbi:hypothetical protein CBF45_15135 [Bordetella sp. J329]|jgi:hypothetical protein|uniref:hypothetical protein n=1 Tax=Kerstersia gyiorum TaxID=206506 RepID=UPI000FD98848|nr:hypothetical protein [Kerstersia gyiorum]AZV94889.1 hypothetical protein CBF45_15135 [Bordetella sp. J329]MCH4270668.1 hypothetical protein [Kerstersia gyiorum]MCI1230138.1 hypothetical protein [Kerstersia gyiorum]